MSTTTGEPVAPVAPQPPIPPDDAPPSYEAANEVKIVSTIQFQQRQPGNLLPSSPHLMQAGKILIREPDLVMWPSAISYTDMITLLHRRFQSRSGTAAPTKGLRFFYRLVIHYAGYRILLEEESWKAAREVMLAKQGARLVFMFAIVPQGYDLRKRFCAKLGAWWRGDDMPCLVEYELGDS